MNIFDKVLFSITREDYQVEYQTIIKRGYKNILTVCSGGCTPLSLNALLHDVKITAFNINPHQINVLDKKLRLANKIDFDGLSVEVKNDKTINQSGQFEVMFLRFRNIFEKYVTTENEIEQLFNQRLSEKKQDKLIHYKIHKNLYIEHADSSYNLIRKDWSKPGKRSDIKKGLVFGNNLILNLYSNLL